MLRLYFPQQEKKKKKEQRGNKEKKKLRQWKMKEKKKKRKKKKLYLSLNVNTALLTVKSEFNTWNSHSYFTAPGFSLENLVLKSVEWNFSLIDKSKEDV